MGKLTWPGIGLATVFWFVDSAFDAVLGEGRVLAQILDPEPSEVWVRSFVGVLFVAFGAYAQRTVVEHREVEETLRELARRDPLTGALNRRAAKEWLDGLCEAPTVPWPSPSPTTA